MFEQMLSWENAVDAYAKSRKGGLKFKPDALEFEQDWHYNLSQLIQELHHGTYKPSEYHSFYVYEPKQRLIVAPAYRDKIVQHMLNNILRDYFEPKFIFDSYACIRNKGNKAAVLRFQQFQRKVLREHGEQAYCAKADIKKFFYSIDRNTLIQILLKKLPCQRTINLLSLFIRSDDSNVGLNLGNLVSQLLANVYMNEVDQRMKRVHKVKYYLRYADDIFIAAKSKAEARRCLEAYIQDVELRLNLEVSPKKCVISPTHCGMVALGYKVYPTHIELKRQAKVRFKRMLKEPNLHSLNSWLGFAKVSKCENLIRRNLPSQLSYDLLRFTWSGHD